MMKRVSIFLFASVLTVALAGFAAGQSAKPAKPTTVKGEIVDMGCYLGHGAKGADHKSCATKCISGGMPMGLLTADGKLYLLTMNHDNADPYNQCKDMAASQVEVSGTVMQRSGVMALDVSSVKAAK